jgi:hypothetical protein
MGKLQPGPKIGQILDILLQDILEDPKNNTKKYLQARAKNLLTLPDEELDRLSKNAKTSRDHIETRRDEMTKQKYWI